MLKQVYLQKAEKITRQLKVKQDLSLQPTSIGRKQKLRTPDGQYYIINKVNTMKYFGIRISFEMWGSGSGARDFCIEYQVGTEEDPWVKLDNSDFQNTEERQNHVFALPKSCDGQANINIRIKRTSTEGISKTISSGGQVRLDNLFITGFAEPTTPTIFSTLD